MSKSVIQVPPSIALNKVKVVGRANQGAQRCRLRPDDKHLYTMRMSIDNWKPDWDDEGWKISRAQIEAKYVTDKEIDLDLEESQHLVSAGKPPLKVKAADRLKDDIDVLLTLTED
jgi:hypothetical protein